MATRSTSSRTQTFSVDGSHVLWRRDCNIITPLLSFPSSHHRTAMESPPAGVVSSSCAGDGETPLASICTPSRAAPGDEARGDEEASPSALFFRSVGYLLSFIGGSHVPPAASLSAPSLPSIPACPLRQINLRFSIPCSRKERCRRPNETAYVLDVLDHHFSWPVVQDVREVLNDALILDGLPVGALPSFGNPIGQPVPYAFTRSEIAMAAIERGGSHQTVHCGIEQLTFNGVLRVCFDD